MKAPPIGRRAAPPQESRPSTLTGEDDWYTHFALYDYFVESPLGLAFFRTIEVDEAIDEQLHRLTGCR